MAIVFDAATSGQNFGPPVNLTQVCTGSDLVVLVYVSIGNISGTIAGATVTATYDSVSMTEARSGTTTGTPLSSSSTSSGGCLFYLLNPNTGSHTLTVTTSGGTINRMVCASASYTGVATVANQASTTSNGASNSPTLVITSASGNFVVGGAQHGDTISGAGGTSTQRAVQNMDNTTSGDNVIIGDSPGATPNLDWTSGVSDHWVMIGLNLSATTPPALLLPIVRSSLRLR
jgi:hypothetical protein